MFWGFRVGRFRACGSSSTVVVVQHLPGHGTTACTREARSPDKSRARGSYKGSYQEGVVRGLDPGVILFFRVVGPQCFVNLARWPASTRSLNRWHDAVSTVSCRAGPDSQSTSSIVLPSRRCPDDAGVRENESCKTEAMCSRMVDMEYTVFSNHVCWNAFVHTGPSEPCMQVCMDVLHRSAPVTPSLRTPARLLNFGIW